MQYRYQCITSKQTSSGKWLTQFAAPAPEIDTWAGVPQKKRFGTGEETAGFQREESPSRIRSLRDFYLNQDNIIQNPLLCSLRDIPGSSVAFEPAPGTPEDAQVKIGELVVEVPDFSFLSFEEILRHVRGYIESRVPELRGRQPDAAIVDGLKVRAAEVGHLEEREPAEETTESTEESGSEPPENGDASGVLFEESHIIDFWQEIAGRHELVKQIDRPIEGDEFLGFTRDALLSYLRPVVVVDGQHRLRGALAAAREMLNDADVQSEVEERIANGESWENVEAEIVHRKSRLLPVSLLMSTEPAEQVFQFIVVNQKATPIGRALLGTIVSTTLSNDEMDSVATRLKNAGIQLEESQAITYLARHPESPFSGLVERGLAGDAKDLLQWNVFSSMIGIFRNLKGGKLFGQRNDYAEIWKQRFLPGSGIVADYETQGFDSPEEYWNKLDGPWRDVFIEFWTKIRDTFGDTKDPDKHNFWGRTRESNLFNKISLTILAADFFQFMVETRTTLGSADEISDLVDTWLENVNTGYFDKNWNLAGVKKDSTGIRNQWAFLWSEYRKSGGNLPDRRLFRQPKGE